MNENEVDKLWESFKHNIIYKNRYFIDDEVVNLLKKFTEILPMFSKDKKVPMKFFRARIGNFMNKPDSEMGPPPLGKASSGRCNPEGIPYFYLASTLGTAFSELVNHSKIGKYKCTVAEYEVDLSNSFSFLPYKEDYKYVIPIKDKSVKRLIYLINRDIAMNVKGDKLKYIPFQYICEYIKQLGYDGLYYASAAPGGNGNLVLFNWENKIKLLNKTLYTLTITHTKKPHILEATFKDNNNNAGTMFFNDLNIL